MTCLPKIFEWTQPKPSVRLQGAKKKEKVAPCNVLLAMVNRAVGCGAWAATVDWGSQAYWDLQTRVIAAEKSILLGVDLGRSEGDEALIARALLPRAVPEGVPP